MNTTAPITPAVRFAAHAWVAALPICDRYTAAQAAMVESFPARYSDEMVARACELLRRQAADPTGDDLSVLRADLVGFHADVMATRR